MAKPVQQALMHGAKALPVIFLTGEGDIPTPMRAVGQSADDFLTKRAPKRIFSRRWIGPSPAMRASATSVLTSHCVPGSIPLRPES